MHTSAYVSIGKAQTRRLRSVCSLLTLMQTPAEAPPLPPPPQERVLPPNTDANASLPAAAALHPCFYTPALARLLLHACSSFEGAHHSAMQTRRYEGTILKALRYCI